MKSKAKDFSKYKDDQRCCIDCIHHEKCEEGNVVDLYQCSNFINNDFYISERGHKESEECFWEEMSYRKFVEGILDYQYSEYDEELNNN